MEASNKHKFLRNFIAFILILFCIQYIPLESRDGVSYIKLAISLCCPLVFLFSVPMVTRPVVIFIIYYSLVLYAALSHPDTLRWSTVLFAATFWAVFVTYYNAVALKQVFTVDYFTNLLRKLIFAYSIVLLLQQLLLLMGIKIFPLLNLVQDLERGYGANSLSYEPSSAAVIMSFAFLSLLRMYELRFGHKLSMIELWQRDKWIVIAFVYTMLGLVSGTAMVGLSVLALYFVTPRRAIIVVPLLLVVLYLVLQIDFTPINRTRDTFCAFLTLDNEQISQADGSAAARVIPIANTITKLDLTTWEGWFGHGVDYGLSKWLFSDRVMIGGIADYGFLSFLVMQVAVYTCMIRKFFSLESLLWLFVGLLTLANVPINWGAMMMFTAVRNFQLKKSCLMYR